MSVVYKYRFKTRQEMIHDFGIHWKSASGWNDRDYMDYLLGTDIDVPEHCTDRKGNITDRFPIINKNHGGFHRWVINHKMLVKISFPTYKPKILIRE